MAPRLHDPSADVRSFTYVIRQRQTLICSGSDEEPGHCRSSSPWASSSASESSHWTTTASGRMPRTLAPAWMSSRLMTSFIQQSPYYSMSATDRIARLWSRAAIPLQNHPRFSGPLQTANPSCRLPRRFALKTGAGRSPTRAGHKTTEVMSWPKPVDPSPPARAAYEHSAIWRR